MTALAKWFRILSIAGCGSCLSALPHEQSPQSPPDSLFEQEMMASMRKMDQDMGAAPMTGNPNHDFSAMMIPHHQGAIDMAKTFLLHGQDAALRRLAQEIIVTQQQEIQVMQLRLATLPTAGGSAPTEKKQDAAARLPVSEKDRVYTGDQTSNTVSVINPASNKLLGIIHLGDPVPGALSPLYRGQLLVHGLGFSPDHRTIAVVSIGSNSVTFIDTATNAVKHTTYVGRSPHEAVFTMDGTEVWVVIRGENYVSVLDVTTYEEKTRITVPNGPGMTIFSPDGKYAYVCSSFTPETEVITVADHKIVGKVPQASPFCPNIAATPDSKQVWFTLKDTGKTQVFDGQPPFAL